MTEQELTTELGKLNIDSTTDGMIAHLGQNLQQITQTNESGWFAYCNSHLPGVTTRSPGQTMRLALLNVCYALEMGKIQIPEMPSLAANPE